MPDSVQDKSVPAEQITEEAKKAEPDAVEQADKVGPFRFLLGAELTGSWRRRDWTRSRPLLNVALTQQRPQGKITSSMKA